MRLLIGLLAVVMGCTSDAGACQSDDCTCPASGTCAHTCASGDSCHVSGTADQPVQVTCDHDTDCHVECAESASCEVDCGGSPDCRVACPPSGCEVQNCDPVSGCVVSCGLTGATPTVQGTMATCP